MIAFPISGSFFYAIALANPDDSPASGLTDVFAYLSDTDGDLPITPIAPQLSYVMTEIAPPGTYEVIFPAEDLAAHLPRSRVGRSGWIVIQESGVVLASDEIHFETSQRVLG